MSRTASPTKSTIGSPLSAPSVRNDLIAPLSLSSSIATVRSRGWCKDDWKLLDRCFLDERCEMAADRGLSVLVDTEEVPLDNVVNRFITMSGGQDIVEKLGVDWTK